DGIRDGHVTGVQTCALPISRAWRRFPLLLQPRDQRVIVKSFVGADNDRPDSAGNLRQARGKQVQRSAGSMNIARPQLAVPEVLALALETEQRVIRGAPSLDWVLTAPGLLLLTV